VYALLCFVVARSKTKLQDHRHAPSDSRKHSNYGDTAQKTITHVVKQIRKHYSKDVPILLRCDSGFFDQKLFRCFQELCIDILCGGKHYADSSEHAGSSTRRAKVIKQESDLTMNSEITQGKIRIISHILFDTTVIKQKELSARFFRTLSRILTKNRRKHSNHFKLKTPGYSVNPYRFNRWSQYLQQSWRYCDQQFG